jgi:hypothetical protein
MAFLFSNKDALREQFAAHGFAIERKQASKPVAAHSDVQFVE